MMPDIKGYDVCKKIKSGKDTRHTKIIVLSAYLDEEKFNKIERIWRGCLFFQTVTPVAA